MGRYSRFPKQLLELWEHVVAYVEWSCMSSPLVPCYHIVALLGSSYPRAATMADAPAYSGWRKGGELLLPARVVGLALELLFLAESQYDLSVVCAGHCAVVHFWETQRARENPHGLSFGTVPAQCPRSARTMPATVPA